MTSSSPDRGYSWDSLPKVEKLPRYLDAVGVRCARDGCSKTEGITFDKPLCYSHWKDFDAYLIFECQRCHWFDELVGEFTEDDLCYECVDRKRWGFSPTPVYPHGPVERHIRYLYILKLDDGKYYVGQTNDLKMRFHEHLDGLTHSTRGKKPKLVYFEEWVGRSDELTDEENDLTVLATKNPRVIRRMVEEWQKRLRLVDLTP